MEATSEELINANEFCIYHNVEISFINDLHQSGLIDILIVNETIFIHTDQLLQLEKLARLHYEMDINLEGIETITHLLKEVNELQNEISRMRNRLNVYEQ
jgi:hypothetical protein